VIYDAHTGLRKGYAFAEYRTPREAVEAANDLNGLKVAHKFLKVALARPREAVTQKGNLHITGIPQSWSIIDLFNYFRFLGQLISCKILTDPITRMSRGIAFVRFANHEEASDVRSRLNGEKPYGEREPLIMNYAHACGPRALQRQATTPSVDGSTHSGASSPPSPSEPTETDLAIEQQETGGSYLRTLPMPQPVRNNLPQLSQQEVADFMATHRPLFEGLPRPARQYFNSWPIFVGNLDNTQGETFLKMVFQQYGALESVKVMQNGTPRGHGFGFVNMWNPDEAIVAVLSLNGKEVNGRTLVVHFKALTMQPRT